MNRPPLDTAPGHELVLDRLLAAPRPAIWRAWTQPELLCRWFAPLPWTTPAAEIDLRPGGAFNVTMRSPDGEEFPNEGVILDVEPERRLVSTDAYRAGWRPSEKPFMTLVLTLEDEGNGTRYTARVRHWNAEDRARHEAMGFHDGWGQCADQLEAVAREIA